LVFLDNLIVRVNGDVLRVSEPIRQIVGDIDPGLPVAGIRPMTEIVGLDVADRRQQATLLGCFGGLALLLAAMGLYGVLAETVTQRRPELGLRIALGASVGSIVRMIGARGLRLTTAGLVIGLPVAWGTGRVLKSLLFGVAVEDPATYAGMTAVLLTTALVACYLPAWRATKIDPLIALRCD
jgi:ABC-type antimicrobial peptide transport system permease subunit